MRGSDLGASSGDLVELLVDDVPPAPQHARTLCSCAQRALTSKNEGSEASRGGHEVVTRGGVEDLGASGGDLVELLVDDVPLRVDDRLVLRTKHGGQCSI